MRDRRLKALVFAAPILLALGALACDGPGATERDAGPASDAGGLDGGGLDGGGLDGGGLDGGGLDGGSIPADRPWLRESGQGEARAAWVRAELGARNAWLSAALLALKYEKMAASPFTFYRGSNHLYWADLGGDARLARFGGEEATRTWLQGDLHTENYGAFDDDDGLVVYDLNDFDESVVADYQLDLWRLAVSVVLVGEENGLPEATIRAGVEALASGYLDALASYVGNDDEVGLSFTELNTYGRLDNFLADVAASESRVGMLDRWTVAAGGTRRLDLSLPELEAVDAATEAAIRAALPTYGPTLSGGLGWDPGYFAIKSLARRLDAGIGSTGTPRFYLLIEGASADPDDDRILDLKRQDGPTPLAYLDAASRAAYEAAFSDHAERAAIAQRALLTDVDDHLGWLSLAGVAEAGPYLVRERSPFKESFPTAELDSETRLTNLTAQWGLILAADHARADADFSAAYVPGSLEAAVTLRAEAERAAFAALLWEVARAYAAQVNEDYASFLTWRSAP